MMKVLRNGIPYGSGIGNQQIMQGSVRPQEYPPERGPECQEEPTLQPCQGRQSRHVP